MRHYFEGRLFEWIMATAMTLLALEIFVWRSTLDASAFHLLTSLMPASTVGVFLLMFGMGRFAALIINGNSLTYGPIVRGIGALGGAVLWAQFDLALLAAFIDYGGPPSPGIPFWLTFTIGELYSAYRAANDVGRIRIT